MVVYKPTSITAPPTHQRSAKRVSSTEVNAVLVGPPKCANPGLASKALIDEQCINRI